MRLSLGLARPLISFVCFVYFAVYSPQQEKAMSTSTKEIEQLANREYKYGFYTDIETEEVPKGLSEDVIRLISAKKHEPEWLLEWRLKAYRHWLPMEEPRWWPNITYARI